MTTRAVIRGIGSCDDVASVERTALLVAAALAAAGVRAGDRVLLPADTTPEHLVLLLALVHVDASVVVGPESVADRCRVRWQLRATGELLDASSARRADVFDGPSPTDDGFDPSRWFDRADALINWTCRPSGQSVAELRSGRQVLGLLDELHGRLATRPGDVLAPMVSPSSFTGAVLLLHAWTSGCDVLLVSRDVPVPDAVRAMADASATVVVTGADRAREFALAVAAAPGLRDDLRSLRAVNTLGRVGDSLAGAVHRACGVRPEALAGSSGSVVLEPAGWILHEEPAVDTAGADTLDAGIRELLAAIRDDHGVFERIVDASSRRREARRRSESAAQSLAAVLGEELTLAGSWTAALSA